MLCLSVIRFLYQFLAKPIFFRFDPELVHNSITNLGEFIGSHQPFLYLVNQLFCQNKKYPQLAQTIAGIDFPTPIGLAAGFDYDAKLTQVLPSLGFGFGTVGTITNRAYDGNPRPMLGRLPKSKSLMVNKGFKNRGAIAVSDKLSKKQFNLPLGVSIGRTNNSKLTQSQSVSDITNAIRTFEASGVTNSYYELNISCPNLYGNVTFYTPTNLGELLSKIGKLKIQKPLFIKMPIEKDDKTILDLLKVISEYRFVAGVIFGNLQKNRSDPALIAEEVAKFKVGNFSGKPTWSRSNELIKLTYKNYAKRFVIIGCGGVFSAEDAYHKITLGASLVQLITGLIFEGPQLVSEINQNLDQIISKNKFSHISASIGSGVGNNQK